MSILQPDLSLQEYTVFDTKKSNTIDLSAINFIFGKNGSGKSTFSELIKKQYGTSEYEVYIYTGMQDLLVDEKLNTIVLGEENKEARIKIESIDSEINICNTELNKLVRKRKSLDWKLEYEQEGITKNPVYLSWENAEKEFDARHQIIEGFYTYGAKEIRDYDSSIKLVLNYYDKNNFKKDIKDANELTKVEVNNLISKLGDSSKSKINEYKKLSHDYKKLLNSANSILSKQPKQIEKIIELQNNEKKDFAMKGKQLHKPGEKCSFCGQIYTEERAEKLERFFSIDDLKEINSEIDTLISKVDQKISELNSIEAVNETLVYDFLVENINDKNENLLKQKQIIGNFLENIKVNLQDKRKEIFNEFELIDLDIPTSLNPIIDEINRIIKSHNDFTDNFEKEQEIAREKLRLHVLYEIISDPNKFKYRDGWGGLASEKSVLDSLEKRLSNEKNILEREIGKITGNYSDINSITINGLKNKIKNLEDQRKEYLKDTKNTEYLAKIINEKLSSSGKKDLQLKACNTADNVECYMISDENDGIRDISKVSTGEKNIIAFLYFIGNIKSQDKSKKKIIIFDDPMNSNDDTLQYLIITELQKLYRGTNKIFDRNKDVFICMTHNVHFYLNVQPHGYYEDKNGKTKYDKNCFYILKNGEFCRIKSQSEDFKTSYEALWMELNDLYENNYLNSMLNSMRRIVETFIKFNKINQDKFYKDKEEHLKIFNVNSHDAIDNLSAESIGKTKDELSIMFKELFKENGYESHYNSYWKH